MEHNMEARVTLVHIFLHFCNMHMISVLN